MPPPKLAKAMIVIAVSEYPAPYPALPGALTSAKRLAAWARNASPARDYKVLEITDERIAGKENPVTVARLKTEITALLAGNFIDRLVIYFAGHGIVRSAGDQFWLLSDAINEGVDVNKFLRRLRRKGIGQSGPLTQGQVCVIADACRSTGKEAVDFDGDAILNLDGTEKPLQLDFFQSTSLGEQAFHVNATPGSPPACLFSAIFTDALEGKIAEVIESAHHPYRPAIVNHRLADYLQREVPIQAAKLQVAMEPDITTGIRPDENYYDLLPGDLLAAAGPDPAGAILAPPGADIQAAKVGLEPTQPSPPVSTFKIAPECGESADRKAARDAKTEEYQAAFRKAGKVYGEALAAGWIGEQGRAAVCEIQEASPLALPVGLHQLSPYSHERFCYTSRSPRCAPLFVKQENGWLLVPLLDRMTSIVANSLPGDVLLHRTGDSPVDDKVVLSPDPASPWDASLSSHGALAAMPPLKVSDMWRFADAMREGKAKAPNNANIAGYLYSLVGDQQNIQRTAHYMVLDAILPIDLALLAAERLWWKLDDEGVWAVWADLPAVPKDDGQASVGNRPYYAREAFEARKNVPVQGLLPIHRQGWALLAENEHLEAPDFLREIANKPLNRAAVMLPDDAMKVLEANFNYQVLTL